MNDIQFSDEDGDKQFNAFSFIAWYDKDPSEDDAVITYELNNTGGIQMIEPISQKFIQDNPLVMIEEPVVEEEQINCEDLLQAPTELSLKSMSFELGSQD